MGSEAIASSPRQVWLAGVGALRARPVVGRPWLLQAGLEAQPRALHRRGAKMGRDALLRQKFSYHRIQLQT